MALTLTPSDKFEGSIMSAALKRLELELRIPTGYLVSLREVDSDWDFIVRLSIIIEGILTRAIHLEEQGAMTYEQVSRREQHWRIRMAFHHKLISKADANLLTELSRIRNHFVHRFENMLRPLSDYFNEQNPKRKNAIINTFLSAGISGRVKAANAPQERAEFVQNFRRVTLRSIFPMLLELGYSHDIKKKEKEYAIWRSNQEERLGSSLPPRTGMYLEDRLMIMELLREKRNAEAAQLGTADQA